MLLGGVYKRRCTCYVDYGLHVYNSDSELDFLLLKLTHELENREIELLRPRKFKKGQEEVSNHLRLHSLHSTTILVVVTFQKVMCGKTSLLRVNTNFFS